MEAFESLVVFYLLLTKGFDVVKGTRASLRCSSAEQNNVGPKNWETWRKLRALSIGKPTRQGPVGPVEIPEENGTIFSDYCKLGQPIGMAFAIFYIFSEGAFHSAEPTGQRSVGIPEENGTTFSD